MRLAVATEDFGKPLRQAIQQAGACEVDGLRLNARTEIPSEEFSDTALRQLRLRVEERQMRVAGVLFPSRRPLYEQQNLERRLQGIRAAMGQVRKLGTQELLVRCGQIPDPQSEETVRTKDAPTNAEVDSLANPFSFAPTELIRKEMTSAQQFHMLAEILNDLAREGNHVGCTLQLQLASFQADRVRSLLNQVTSGPIQIVFDPAAVVMSGGQPVKSFRELYASVGYIRARDALRDMDGTGAEVAVGDGVVDWTELLPTLSEADYTGWICIERAGGDQRADDVRRGVEKIRQLISFS